MPLWTLKNRLFETISVNLLHPANALIAIVSRLSVIVMLLIGVYSKVPIGIFFRDFGSEMFSKYDWRKTIFSNKYEEVVSERSIFVIVDDRNPYSLIILTDFGMLIDRSLELEKQFEPISTIESGSDISIRSHL